MSRGSSGSKYRCFSIKKSTLSMIGSLSVLYNKDYTVPYNKGWDVSIKEDIRRMERTLSVNYPVLRKISVYYCIRSKKNTVSKISLCKFHLSIPSCLSY